MNHGSQQGGLNRTGEVSYSAGFADAVECQSGGVARKRQKHLEASDSAAGAAGSVSRKRHQSLGEGTTDLNGPQLNCPIEQSKDDACVCLVTVVCVMRSHFSRSDRD